MLFSDAEPGLDDTKAAALDRLARLAAALPDNATRTHFRLSELKDGDAIYHPGYSFAPFILRENPDDHGDHVTLTGVLASRRDAAVIRWQFHKNGADDPVVAAVPLPPSQPAVDPGDKRSA